VNERRNVPSVEGGPDTGEQPAHRAVPQQAHILEAVRAGDHPRDQRGDLQVRVPATGLVDPHMLADQVLQAGALGELQDRRETCARHEVGVIEDHGTDVTESHLPDALRLWLNRSLDKTNSLAAQGHLAFTTRPSAQAERWIRA
jgi:hypothetical protein